MAKVIVQVFDGARTARRALDKVIDKNPDAAGVWLEDVAVISRKKSGRIKVDSTWGRDTTAENTTFGSLTGLIVGAFFGPAGALTGLISGGALGTLTGSAIAVDLTDPRLEELKDSLVKDSSALVLVESDPKKFIDTFAFGGPKIVRATITEKELEALRNS
ncbi:MAG: DUF1269 domain-containing protein [Bacteroidota bacterium]